MALGCAHGNSDVDLLVDLQPGRSLLDLIAIKQVLEPLDELQSGT
jgi:predicted nucleotidyltransferase